MFDSFYYRLYAKLQKTRATMSHAHIIQRIKGRLCQRQRKLWHTRILGAPMPNSPLLGLLARIIDGIKESLRKKFNLISIYHYFDLSTPPPFQLVQQIDPQRFTQNLHLKRSRFQLPSLKPRNSQPLDWLT